LHRRSEACTTAERPERISTAEDTPSRGAIEDPGRCAEAGSEGKREVSVAKRLRSYRGSRNIAGAGDTLPHSPPLYPGCLGCLVRQQQCGSVHHCTRARSFGQEAPNLVVEDKEAVLHRLDESRYTLHACHAEQRVRRWLSDGQIGLQVRPLGRVTATIRRSQDVVTCAQVSPTVPKANRLRRHNWGCSCQGCYLACAGLWRPVRVGPGVCTGRGGAAAARALCARTRVEFGGWARLRHGRAAAGRARSRSCLAPDLPWHVNRSRACGRGCGGRDGVGRERGHGGLLAVDRREVGCKIAPIPHCRFPQLHLGTLLKVL